MCGAGCGLWRRHAASGRGARAACRGKGACDNSRLGGAGRGEAAHAKHLFMFVTREVSQLSGWLKALAYCRGVASTGHTVRGGLRAVGRHAGERLRCARSMQGEGRV